MKIKNLIVYILTLLLAVCVPIQAASSKRKARRATRTQSNKSELLELLRRTRQAVEEARAEARRARQQSEELLDRLEENTREIARLRQTIADYGLQIANLKTDRAGAEPALEPTQPAAQSAAQLAATSAQKAPAEGSEQSAIRSLRSTVEERFDRLQEQVEINTTQIKEHAQTKVESDSRFRVKLFGMVLANTYFNSNDSSQRDVPKYAPPPAAGASKNNFGATLRQSRIGLAMEGPRLSQRLGNARLSAEAEFDFWGAVSRLEDGDVLGALRIVTASARLDWEKSSLVVGQRQPFISPRNPDSIAAVWISPLADAGNLWQWRPQAMLEHRLGVGDSSQLILQGGIMTPFGEMLQERVIEGGPGYESRIAYRRDLDSEQSLEFGFGGYIHRRSFPFARRVNSYAITGDWLIPLGSRLEVKGEAYFGRAIGLGEESGSSNEALYAMTGLINEPGTSINGINSVGGWAQLSIRARSDLDFNLAYGQNDPRNRDILSGLPDAGTRFKNQNASANFIWQLRHNLLLSLEYRRLWTDYAAGQQTNNHFNLAVGYLF